MRPWKTLLAAGVTLIAFAIAPASALATDTTIDSGPANGSTSTAATATFTFHSADPAPKFTCTLDGAAISQAECASPYTTPALSSGQHTFTVAASSGGMVDPTPASVTWTVDLTPPTLAMTIDTSRARLAGNGAFGIEISCPASSAKTCTGTLRARSDCCQAGAGKSGLKSASISITAAPGGNAKSLFKKHVANIKWCDLSVSIEPGQTLTATYKATQGKTGKATQSKSAFTADKPRGRPTLIKRVEVAILQPGAPTLPGSEYSADKTVQVYSAKQGKTGKTK
jgi:hypothetical protein